MRVGTQYVVRESLGHRQKENPMNRRTRTLIVALLLTLTLSACEATKDCGVERGAGNPSQSHASSCGD